MSDSPRSFSVWLSATRPKTLPAAIVPVWVGTLLAYELAGEIDLWLAVCTLLGAVFIQISTNFFNDAIDADKGADTADRLGPRRATGSGDVSSRAMIIAGVICLAVAGFFGAFLWAAAGWRILVIGLVSAYFAYGYTGGFAPLAYLGLGEIFVVLFFGLVAVSGTVFVQLRAWPDEAFLAGLQVGLLSAVLISVNNLRDRKQDALVGKNTLAVRLGLFGARQVIIWEVALAGALACYWLQSSDPELRKWIFTGLPSCTIGWIVVWQVLAKAPGRHLNRTLAVSALMLVSYAVVTGLLTYSF